MHRITPYSWYNKEIYIYIWFIKFLLVSCSGVFGKNCKSGSAIFVHKSIGMVVVVLYSIGTLSCMREREREGLLEELEVGLKGQEDDERKGENRKR